MKALIFISRRNFSSAKPRATFIGLGNMGLHMATNLLKQGKYSVSGFDLNKEQESLLVKNGGDQMTLEESLEQSSVVMTMLNTGDIVKKTWRKCFPLVKKGTVFIDSSTISPLDSKEISKEALNLGLIPCDAPVSGGVVGAKNGTLTFIVGSQSQDFESLKTFLLQMGKNVFYCGENSTGQVAKICNNLVLGITTIGVSESVALGVKLGIDPKVLTEIMSVSTAYSWSVNVNNPVPGVFESSASSRNYDNGYNTCLITKDLNIGLDCAKEVGFDLEMTRRALNYYETIENKGHEKKDFSYVYQYILNDKKI